MSGINRRLWVGSLLMLATGWLLLSCAGETKCVVCDGVAEESAAATACGDLVKAMTACDISLGDLSSADAAASCEENYEGPLAGCYLDCYADYSRCSFWADCVGNCQSDFGRWSAPADGDDNNDEGQQVTGCEDAYLWLYGECAIVFTDPDGDGIEVDAVIAACEAGQDGYSDDYLKCLVDFYDDCDAAIACLIEIVE